MPQLTLEEVKLMMNDPSVLRNISIIGEIDHGKTTTCDLLIQNAGILPPLNIRTTGRVYREKQEEKDSFKWPPATFLGYKYDPDKTGTKWNYIINVVEASKHPDLFSEVASTLNIVDGVVLVVDIIEGVGLQTEILLRKTASERVKPILMINKLDRPIIELEQSAEEIYQTCKKIVDSVNVVLSSYENPEVGDILIDPYKGNVVFGCARRSWGFTINTFAFLYSKKFGLDKKTMASKLWGENYFDFEEKKWIAQNISKGGKPLKRGFAQFIIEPITKLYRIVLDGNLEQIEKVLSKIEVVLDAEDREFTGQRLLKVIMQKWINAADCLLGMIIVHLPSPQAAQKYRVSHLYDGPQNDACAQAIRDCNPKGPLMFYVSKVVTTRQNKYYAFGRVFSGNVRESQEVRLMGPAYRPGRDDDLSIVKLKKIVILFGRSFEEISEAPCGNVVCLGEIDGVLAKKVTLSDHPDACKIRPIKHSLCPQIQMIVEPKDPKDLPNLVTELRHLTKLDPHVTVTQEVTGQHILSSPNKIHLEKCINDFRIKDVPFDLIHYDPLVPFRETIVGVSQLCMANSQNRCNRIYCTAQPLTHKLSSFLEEEHARPRKDQIERAARFEQDFQWTQKEIETFWTSEAGPNILVDLTEGVEFMEEIKYPCFDSFKAFVEEGPLCGLKVKNMRVNIVNAILSSDRSHRYDRAIFSMTKKVYEGCELSAQPRLLEAFYLIEIKNCIEDLSSIQECVTRKGGVIIDEQLLTDTSICLLKCYMPIIEAFGLEAKLMVIATGNIMCWSDFSHWVEVDGDPFEKNSLAYEIVSSIRARKGLNQNQLLLENYLDNL